MWLKVSFSISFSLFSLCSTLSTPSSSLHVCLCLHCLSRPQKSHPLMHPQDPLWKMRGFSVARATLTSTQAERVKGKPLIVTFSHSIEDHVNQNVSPTPACTITAESQRERWRSLRWQSDALISECFSYTKTNCSFTCASAERPWSTFKHKLVYAQRSTLLHLLT